MTIRLPPDATREPSEPEMEQPNASNVSEAFNAPVDPNAPRTFNEDIVHEVLKHEGGYVNLKEDKGGPTNLGITKESYAEWKKIKINASKGKPKSAQRKVWQAELDRKVLTQTIIDLTREDAKKFYGAWMKRYKIDKIPEAHRHQIMDMSVNHGNTTAFKIIGKMLIAKGLGTEAGIKPWGWGPNTERALAALPEDEMNNEIMHARMVFYDKIIQNDDTQEKFRNGWNSRAAYFHKESASYEADDPVPDPAVDAEQERQGRQNNERIRADNIPVDPSTDVPITVDEMMGMQPHPEDHLNPEEEPGRWEETDREFTPGFGSLEDARDPTRARHNRRIE